MRLLLGGGLLEIRHAAAEWIDATQNMRDDAVFTGGVETLQYNQQRLASLRVKTHMAVSDARAIGFERFFGVALIDVGVDKSWIRLTDFEAFAGLDEKFPAVVRHGNSPRSCLALRTRSTPIAMAAVRFETLSFSARRTTWRHDRSRACSSRLMTSFFDQKYCWRSCTHSK